MPKACGPCFFIAMTPIVLTTLNARYAHASLGLRYLRANLGAWRERADLRHYSEVIWHDTVES